MPTAAANWPIPLCPIKLCGRIIELEPLLSEHEHELATIALDQRIWRYLTGYGGTADAMRQYIAASMRDYTSGCALPFVVRALSDGRAVGMTRLKNVSREHRKASVGSWFTPSAWGSGANTESKLLVLKHAFENLGCIRVEFDTDVRNLRSRAALAKIGATEEGLLRSHHIMRDGFRRDTVIFSILDTEWPLAMEKLAARLDL